MSATLVDVRSRLKRPSQLIVDRDDRWSMLDVKTRRITAAALLVMVGSAALHALFIVAALFQAPSTSAPAEEAVSVEVVKQVPQVDAARPAPAPAGSKDDQTKQKQAAADQAKPDVERKPSEPAQPQPSAASQPAPAPGADAAAELAALKQELAALRAAPATGEATPQVATGQPAGVGPEPSQQQATALPGPARDGDGDLVGYTALVFSQLAKAKAIGSELGIPGTAGVRFAIDEHGALVTVELAASSGIARLDVEAVALVRKAAPFPVPPAGAQRDFTANVSFVAGLNR